MRNLDKLKSTKDKVRSILEQRVDSRDNDSLLIGLFWYHEDKPFFDGRGTALDFMRKLSKGEFSSSESIRRCRQKIQEDEPHTRGTGYKEKKTKIEREVRSNINKL